MQSSPQKQTYLFVIPWPLKAIGGVNQVVINLAREMAEANDFVPLVLIHEWDATRPVVEYVHGIKTIRWRIRSYQKHMGFKHKLAFSLWNIQFTHRFRKLCEDHKVVAINTHFPRPFIFSIERVVRKFRTTIPLIFSFHGADVKDLLSSGKRELIQWHRLLTSADNSVVVCSNDLGRQLVDVVGCEVLPTVVHNGLNVADFSSMGKKREPVAERMILNVAKFEEKKGQDVLINAFAEIAAKYDDLKLVLVGATDRALPGLRALCVNKGIDKRVEFHPDTPHENVADFYKRATLFCLPSRKEPFGIVILESASFAVPVVASRVGGIPEIISDGITGVLVPPDNQSELASSIMSLLDDPVFAKEMGKRLYDHVNSNFSWRTAYEKYVDLLPKE